MHSRYSWRMAAIIDHCASEIIRHWLQWDDQQGLIAGRAPSLSLKRGVKAIRDAPGALSSPKKQSTSATTV